MSVRARTATVYSLSCDVADCPVTSPAGLSIGATVNVAVGECGWATFGPGRHVCNFGDALHLDTKRRFEAELREELAT